MAQNNETPDTTAGADGSAQPAPPITSRFLFVDVAAQRAKQLRRGALPRLERTAAAAPHKLERVAMEEVRRGLVKYDDPMRDGGMPANQPGL